MANLIELWRGGEHGTAKPNGITLHLMRDHLDIDGLGFDAALAQVFVLLEASVDRPLDVSLQFATEIAEHG